MPSSIRGMIAAVTIAALFMLPVMAAPYNQDLQAIINSPVPGQQVSGLVDIIGSATSTDFLRYELSYASDPSPSDPNPPPDGWVLFASVDFVLTNAAIGLWDAGVLPEGTYAVRLQLFNSANAVAAESHVRGLVRGAPPTPEPEATPTGVPPAPTFEEESVAPAQPTFIIEQPPTATPLPTVEAGAGVIDAGGTSSDGAPIIDLSRFGSACVSGMTCAIGAYILLGVFVGGRWSIRWILKQARSRETTYPRQSYQETHEEEQSQ